MDKTELIITHTWDTKNNYRNGTCGHAYEVIDYMWFLKDYFDVKIILPELSIDSILLKYNFSEDEKEYIKSRTLVRKQIIRTKGLLLLTDGNLANFNVIIRAKAVLQFNCGINDSGFDPKDNKWELSNPLNKMNKIYNLGDNTIYPKDIIHFNYNKKILFSKIKYSNQGFKYDCMLYLTKNCRYLNLSYINDIIKDKSFIIFSDFLVENDFTSEFNYKVIDIKNPVSIFEHNFKTYIYTPVERQWDCSNRLIPECIYNNINIDTSYINYTDKALNKRLLDSKNINNLNLDLDTNIIDILKYIEEL